MYCSWIYPVHLMDIEGSSKMFIFPITIVSLLTLKAVCQECPAIYLRYSQDHSFCKPKNSDCPIYTAGVKDTDKKLILELHNKYRSFVTTGKEKRAGGMPTAANMIQMVWDKELEGVAQRRAEQCIYAHDCPNCRRVKNFSVGQNIAYRERRCSGAAKCHQNSVPEWTDVIKMFYEEVEIFDKRYVTSMKFPPGKTFGHFTQMLWAETWRIGCGFVAFQKQNGYRQLYVCNYGPSGNKLKKEMYKVGPPCSACPSNSCCGTSCERVDHDGLCRMNRITDSPVYTPKNYLFYCDFRDTTEDCASASTVPKKWQYVKALGGNFAEIVLAGGESSTLKLKKKIRPKERFCLVARYRSGPVLAGQAFANNAVFSFNTGNTSPITMDLPRPTDSPNYFRYTMNLNWSFETEVSLTVSAKPGAPSQYFNIELLAAVSGRCQPNKF